MEETLRRARALLGAGDFLSAAQQLEIIVAQRPGDAEAWFLLGCARDRLGRKVGARRAFKKCCALAPDLVEARFALATVCHALGLNHEALEHCRTAQALLPDDARALTQLGIALEANGRHVEALKAYEDALAIDPYHAEALMNRGALLLKQGRLDEALANNRDFSARHPQRFEAWFNLGDACIKADLTAEAASALDRALALDSNHVEALMFAGLAHALLQEFDQAQPLLDRAARVDPEAVRRKRAAIYRSECNPPARLDARALWLLHHFDRIEQCDWNERDSLRSRFIEWIEAATPPLTDKALGFRALALGLPPSSQLALARHIAGAIRQEVGSIIPTPQARRQKAKGNEKIVLGYLSPDFRIHPNGLLMHRLFALHDRARFRVNVYAIGPATDDWVRSEVRRHADAFTDLSHLDDKTAARRITADGVDLLIDLSGYTDHTRPGILAHRPAPVQLGWLGYLATSGSDWLDYFVLDSICAPPELDDACSEAIVRLPPSCGFCSYALETVSPCSRIEAGLPEGSIVLAAFHNGFKIDPQIFSLWMRLLAAQPKALLWLLAGSAQTKQNLRREAAQRGVDPDRLLFAERIEHARHLGRLACADLLLDTPVCNGGSTVCDALTAGVPVLTCPGTTPIQRIAASLMTAVGTEELVVDDLSTYEALALELLRDRMRLTRLRQKLAEARGQARFFRPQDWVRTFEAALKAVWARHVGGLPPTAIWIEENAKACLNEP